MGFTVQEVVIAILGSGGLIGGLVVAFNAITSRLDARRKRLEEADQKKISTAIEGRRLEIESAGRGTDALIANLWKMIDDKDKELEEVKAELDECNKKYSFSRPVTTVVYRNARAIISEIEAMNVLVLNEEQTQVFMRRFTRMKELATEIQEVLP